MVAQISATWTIQEDCFILLTEMEGSMPYLVDKTAKAHIMFAPPPNEAFSHKGQLVAFIDPGASEEIHRFLEFADDPNYAVAIRPNGQTIIAVGGTISSLEDLINAAYGFATALYFALKVRTEVIALPSFDMLIELCEI